MAPPTPHLFENKINLYFFDSRKKMQNIFRINYFFKKIAFWRSYEFLIRVGRCVVKSYCPKCPYFWGDFLVEGVKDSICVFDLDLAPKMTSTIWCCDVMIIWYDDTMIVCYRHSMISRIYKNCIRTAPFSKSNV